MTRGTLFLLITTAVSTFAGTAVIHAAPSPLQTSPSASAHARPAQPLGATVLYDQSGVEVVNITAQDYPDIPTYSSQIADDFIVTDATGWTLLSVVVQENTVQATDLPGVLYDVSLYADDNGLPAAAAECEYDELPVSFDATSTIATIAFDQSCFLPPGKHWLAATPLARFDTGGQLYASVGDTGVAFGAPPVWQNPGGAWGGVCLSWTPLTTCPDLTVGGLTVTSAMLFQVIGHTGGQPGRIALDVGIALDNGDPAQCGTATDLSLTVGDLVNYCYTVRNDAPFDLNFQSLSDTVAGSILAYAPTVIAAGTSYQYNRTAVATVSQSPMSTWTAAVSKPGYDASAGSDAFVDISTTGTALDLADDGGAAIAMPFSFTLYDATSNQLCVNNNGIVLFAVSGDCSGLFSNEALPSAQIHGMGIAPFWDDFLIAGDVFYQTVGATPDRRFVVEYFQTDGINGTPTPGYTFEVILNEADGSIDFNYANVTSGGSPTQDGGVSATVGLQLNAELANQYSFDTAALGDGQNIHWTPAPTPISFSTSRRVSLDVGAPIMSALPGPVDASAAAGAATSAPLYILNTGNRDLVWSVVEAPGAQKLPPAAPFVRPALTKATAVGGVAPRLQRPPAASVASPFGSSVVPAFGMTYGVGGNAFVALDASVPDNLTSIASVGGDFVSGTFKDFDFSREYVVDAPAGDLYTIDTDDGSLTLIGNTGLPATEKVGGIRWDATSGTTYMIGTACSDDFSSNNSTLYTIDLATAAITPIGAVTFTCIADIAIDPLSGQLSALDTLFDYLFALDKTTAEIIGAAPIGFDAQFAQGLDYDASTGVLYLAGYDGTAASMYTIDPYFGGAVLVGAIGDGTEMAAFAIARATPPCDRPGDVPWLSLDATSGSAAPGLYSTVGVGMDASTLAAGAYSATLCVHSNDYLHPLSVIPVNFTVTGAGGDRIFVDGFDGA